MCLGIPGRVVALSSGNADLAKVDVAGVERDINVALLHDGGGVRPGEWVLIHVGFALSKLAPEEVQLVLASLKMMAEGQVDEMEAELPSRSAADGGRLQEREGPVWAS